MSRPFLRYCYSLARENGYDVDEVLSWPSSKVMKWMAFDMTRDEDWLKNYNEELEIKKQEESPEYQAMLLKKMLGGA